MAGGAVIRAKVFLAMFGLWCPCHLAPGHVRKEDTMYEHDQKVRTS